MKIIATIGIVASGKSTWAKDFALKNGFKYISSDETRAELCGGDAGDQSKNAQVFRLIETRLMEVFKDNGTVVFDATLYNESNRKTVEQFVNWGAEIEYHYFPISLADAFKRNKNRDRVVPESVIRKQFSGLSLPEDRKIIWHNVPEENNSKMDCFVSDIDGTISILNGRNPYDASTCENDLPNEAVIRTLKLLSYNGLPILFVSGREDKYRTQTMNFISRYFPENMAFILKMRKTGDNRKDSLIKAEIYYKEIKPFYNVVAWFDDRDQVVKMVRNQLNLSCFQVAEGNF